MAVTLSSFKKNFPHLATGGDLHLPSSSTARSERNICLISHTQKNLYWRFFSKRNSAALSVVTWSGRPTRRAPWSPRRPAPTAAGPGRGRSWPGRRRETFFKEKKSPYVYVRMSFLRQSLYFRREGVLSAAQHFPRTCSPPPLHTGFSEATYIYFFFTREHLSKRAIHSPQHKD